MIRNLNDLAVEISRREGGKYNMPIAQIKECLRHTLDLIATDMTVEELTAVLRKRHPRVGHRKRKRSKCR